MSGQALSDELYASATQFARSGLRAFLEGDAAIFLLHTATSLEHLAKASLASLHGSLIAGKDFNSLLHTCGLSQHADAPRSAMKTIGIRDSLDRAGQVIPELRNLSKSLNLLADIRNGIVHAGQLDAAREESVLVPYLRACDYLLASIPAAKREAFWGDLLDVVDVRLSESAQIAERMAAERLTAARFAFEERFGSMDKALRDAVIKTIEEGYEPDRYEEDLHECPACSHQALVHGSYDVDWEADFDYDRTTGESYPVGAYPVVTFFPGDLHCRVCDLSLDQEELRAAGLASSWQLQNADATDFYDYDEDDHRYD